MRISPVVLEVIAAHIDALNAENDSKAQRAAFRRRDAALKRLDEGQREGLACVGSVCRRLAFGDENYGFSPKALAAIAAVTGMNAEQAAAHDERSALHYALN